MSGKYALIIGTTEYQDASFPKLNTPTKDVVKLAEVLQSKDIGAFDDVHPLINESEQTIRRTLVTFFENRMSDDLLLLYFSGHGVIQERTNRLFLAVRDTERDLLGATAISSSFVTEQMDNCASRQQVLVLDCCHSGAFAQGAKGEAGGSVGTSQAFQGMGSGRVIMTASDATQNAYEGANTSIFTQYLVNGLATGEADRDRDGMVGLEEWYRYAYDQVVSKRSGQTPAMFTFQQKGTIQIAKNPKPPEPPKTLPEELQQAMVNPLPAYRLQAVYSLKALLYSKDTGLAKVAEEALTGMVTDDSNMVLNNARLVLEEYWKSIQPKNKPPEQVISIPTTGTSNTTPQNTPDNQPPKNVTKTENLPPSNVTPASSLLPRKMAELNQIIDVLGSNKFNPAVLRGQLSQWRSETAAIIQKERGIAAALMFGAINAPANLSVEVMRMRSIAEQCRQALLGYMQQ